MKRVPVYLSEEDLLLLRKGLSAINPLTCEEVDDNDLIKWAKLYGRLEEELDTFSEE